MYSNEDESKEEILVNGGRVFLPRRGEWARIIESSSYSGKPFGMAEELKGWIEYRLLLSDRFPELSIGLYSYGSRKSELLPIVILTIDDSFQKVHIERLVCSTCGWTGETANPMLPELYDDKTWVVECRKAERFDVKGCPVCDSRLPRNPIWIQLQKDT